MSDTVPTQSEPDPAEWIVVFGVDSLRALAGNHLHRQEATELLPYWKHYPAMTTSEVVSVLAHFPVRQPVPEHHGLKIGTRHPDSK